MLCKYGRSKFDTRVWKCYIFCKTKRSTYTGNSISSIKETWAKIKDNSNDVLGHALNTSSFGSSMMLENGSITSYQEVLLLCRSGQLAKACQTLDMIDNRHADYTNACICILKACIRTKSLAEGKHVHGQINKIELGKNTMLGNTLISLYIKCGSVDDARYVFGQMSLRNVFTWTMVIAGYIQQGKETEAIQLYLDMPSEGIEPDIVTFTSVISACARSKAIYYGKLAHSDVLKREWHLDIVICNALADLYSKCGRMEDRQCVFDRMTKRDIIAWNAMIAAYIQNANNQHAFQLYWQMKKEDVRPNKITFITVLGGCVTHPWGKFVHSDLLKGGVYLDIVVGSVLIDMYARFGIMANARQVFTALPVKNVISWTVIILGYARYGDGKEALRLYASMKESSTDPNKVTFLGLLSACIETASIGQGKRAHAEVLTCGFQSDLFLANSLVNMYCKLGTLFNAHQVIDRMPKLDVASWNAIIGGHAEVGHCRNALRLFLEMRKREKHNKVTFINILNAFVGAAALGALKFVYSHVLKTGYDCDIFVCNSLSDAYAKSGNIHDANQVFDTMPERDVVSWNVMIAGYAKYKDVKGAFKLFRHMRDECLNHNVVSFISILSLCNSLIFERGKHIHAQVLGAGYCRDVVISSALIDMYANTGSIGDAQQVFNRMHTRDIVAWNAIIFGYAMHQSVEQAIILFKLMQDDDMKPNEATFSSVLTGCAGIAALEQGSWIHKIVLEAGYGSDIVVASALIDMYAKSGSIENAQKIFINMEERDVVTWNAITAGYAQCGDTNKVFKLFWQMQEDGLEPDDVSFISILCACSYAHAAEECIHYFSLMNQSYAVTVEKHHFAIIVDVLGYSGQSNPGEDLVTMMPFEPNIVIYMSLLDSCRIHGVIDLADRLLKQILILEPSYSAAFVLLSNTYAAAEQNNTATLLNGYLEED